jgi:hypothetical protein
MQRSLGEPKNWSGRCGEEKILDHTGTRTPSPRSSSPYPVAIPITLSRNEPITSGILIKDDTGTDTRENYVIVEDHDPIRIIAIIIFKET